MTTEASTMKYSSKRTYSEALIARRLGTKAWLCAALQGRAIVRGTTASPRRTVLGVLDRSAGYVTELHEERAPADSRDQVQVATDGVRLVAVSRARLVLWHSLDARPRSFSITAPNKDVYVLGVALVPNEQALWAVLSDTFAVSAGRYVAKLTWSDRGPAKWGARRQPFDFSASRYHGVVIKAIGAASSTLAHVVGLGVEAGVLAARGTSPARSASVAIERGPAAFAPDGSGLLVLATKKRRGIWYDLAGTPQDSLAFKPLGPFKTFGSLGLVAVDGRDLWLSGHDSSVVQCELAAPFAPSRER